MKQTALIDLWTAHPQTLIVIGKPVPDQHNRFEICALCPGQDIYLETHPCPSMTSDEIKAFLFSTLNLLFSSGLSEQKHKLVKKIHKPEPFRITYSKVNENYRIKVEDWQGNQMMDDLTSNSLQPR